MIEVAVVMGLLQIKHWYIDFVAQTDEMVKHKGIYGDMKGVIHSIQHGFVTLLIISLFSPDLAFPLAMLDFVTHYHTDYVKMKFGNRDIKTKAFWNHLGLDQMVHQLVYSICVVLFMLYR